MQLQLTLTINQPNACLPFNYQYPLSAAIYKIIERADETYAAFLHNEGYQHGGKTFKLFTFGSITTPFVPKGDRMLLQTGEAKQLPVLHFIHYQTLFLGK
jgi:CRISPR-associated endoribonuclease Cas6